MIVQEYALTLIVPILDSSSPLAAGVDLPGSDLVNDSIPVVETAHQNAIAPSTAFPGIIVPAILA